MTTLNEVLTSRTTLDPIEREWLLMLTGDWQVLADLGFADLVVWVRTGDGWLAAAHVRPTTGPMVFVEDIVGRSPWDGLGRVLDEAARGERAAGARHERPHADGDIVEDGVPIVRDDVVLGVLTRHAHDRSAGPSSRLDEGYRSLGDELFGMVATGDWPNPAAPTASRRGSPRVGDGVVRLDADGVVTFASPNAQSAVHRLGHHGEIEGQTLAEAIAVLLRDGIEVDESLPLVTLGRAPWRSDVTVGGATVAMRSIPLTAGGQRSGALLLLRDVSELRRSEQEVLSKDATIREIHHRVKNNLQTVAALLRLQARRLDEGPGRVALTDAVRRVGTIALVHETLSSGFDETVNFDDIAWRGLRAIVEVSSSDRAIEPRLDGSFGRMRAEDATPVAMIISELVQNAAEHGLGERGGCVQVQAERLVEDGHDLLRVTIEDDGQGLPAGYRPSRAGLGTRIVTSLVSDLRGTIRWEDAHPRGTRVQFTARLRPLTRGASGRG